MRSTIFVGLTLPFLHFSQSFPIKPVHVVMRSTRVISMGFSCKSSSSVQKSYIRLFPTEPKNNSGFPREPLFNRQQTASTSFQSASRLFYDSAGSVGTAAPGLLKISQEFQDEYFIIYLFDYLLLSIYFIIYIYIYHLQNS